MAIWRQGTEPPKILAMWRKTSSFARSNARAHNTGFSATWLVIGFTIGIILTQYRTPVRYLTAAQPHNAVGELDPTLFRQGLSHNAFHHNLCKEVLVSMFRKHSRVAIVGVEGGNDVKHFAQHGYQVYAFEPMGHSYKHFQDISKSSWFSPFASNVHFYKVAASDVSGEEIIVHYNTGKKRIKEKSLTARLDDYITEPLDLLSADIQGNELDVIRGASKMLGASESKKVRSIWVEIRACNPKAPQLLRQLIHHGYKLFDMVPHGARKNHKEARGLHEFEDAAQLGWDSRPSSIDAYATWLCSLSKTHDWSQTDVLAVRQDLVNPTVMLKLSTLSHRIFGKLAILAKDKVRV